LSLLIENQSRRRISLLERLWPTKDVLFYQHPGCEDRMKVFRSTRIALLFLSAFLF